VCGDRITVSLIMDGIDGTDGPPRIADVSFEGTGCAIATASASMMTLAVKGRTPAEARIAAAELERVVSGRPADPGSDGTRDLAALSGVARFPVRIKCARLAWRALLAALADGTGTVSTEE